MNIIINLDDDDDNDNDIIYIYQIQHIENIEIKYVGKTNNIKNRIRQHISEKSDIGNKLKEEGINKFNINILEITNSKNALEVEKKWIENVKPLLNRTYVSIDEIKYKHLLTNKKDYSKQLTYYYKNREKILQQNKEKYDPIKEANKQKKFRENKKQKMDILINSFINKDEPKNVNITL
jgi:excinuclease UvrABC nuclease subunit